MEVALRGLGSTWIDTGEGITPDNFATYCCGGWFGTFFADAKCKRWGDANAGLFGGSGSSYCSDAGIANMHMGLAIAPVIPPQPPPIVTAGGSSAVNPLYGQAMVPRISCPASVSPCPCDGRLVANEQDAADLLTCQAIQQQQIQIAAQTASLNASQSAACAVKAVDCAGSFFSSFVSPSADCSSCSLDFTKPATLLVIAAIGAFLFVAANR